MSIITEQDQNNLNNLYEEGILNRMRASVGNFIAGGNEESKLRTIIGQYKKKLGAELGDLEADMKTFRGSIQPQQAQNLTNLLINFKDVGVPHSQSLLAKIGHFTGRLAGSVAPAAAITAATGGMGAAPWLAGALGAGVGSTFKQAPRTDISTAGKIGRIGTHAAMGAAAGELGSRLGNYLRGDAGAEAGGGVDWGKPRGGSGIEPRIDTGGLRISDAATSGGGGGGVDWGRGGSGIEPRIDTGGLRISDAATSGGGGGSSLRISDAATSGGGGGLRINDALTSGASSPALPSTEDLLKQFATAHDAVPKFGILGFDPNSPVDAAKMLMQIDGIEKGLTGDALYNFIYRSGGTDKLSERAAESFLSSRGLSTSDVVDMVRNAR